MSFTQQFVQLLSQFPGSIVYHVITLLAVQATLGMALWQRQRNPKDELANRLIWASAGILAGRLIIVFAILLIDDPLGALSTLPPLERAIDAVTAALLVWALSPHPSKFPRLGDILLLITLIVVGFMYAVLAQDWMQQFDAALANGGYGATGQAIIWEAFQLALLALGIVLISLRRQEQWHLRLAIIGTLLLAHLANLLGASQVLSPESSIAYWVRLGNLIAFPLLAALAYRHNLSQLLPGEDLDEPTPGRVAEHLAIASRVLSAGDSEAAVQEALAAAGELVRPEFVALALVEAGAGDELAVSLASKRDEGVSSNGREVGPYRPTLLLSDWPAIRLALHQLQPVELVPSGLGARQLNQLYEQLGVGDLGALLIEPLIAGDKELGVLLFAGAPELERWPAHQKRATRAVADFLALAIDESRVKEDARKAIAALETGKAATYDKRLRKLADERDQAQGEAASPAGRQRLDEAHPATETEKVTDLTAALTAAKVAVEDGRIRALEDEVASLRKSLSDAEEALSRAGRDGGKLSADWVTRTVTRYSGDLEDANERISHLEATLARANDSRAYELIVDHARQLRTPLTALAGYTDLLLGESLGFLGSKQMSLLRRMKLNIETVTRSLGRISAVARQGDGRLLSRATTDAQEAIESAARAMETQFQAKRLNLELSLPETLPHVISDNDGFFRIVVLLLRNASQVSKAGSRLSMGARVVCAEDIGPDGGDSPAAFLHLTVTDAGGRQTWDLHADSLGSPRPNNGKGAHRTAEVDSVTEAIHLVAANDGRTWVERVSSDGCTFSILLPVAADERASENCS